MMFLIGLFLGLPLGALFLYLYAMEWLKGVKSRERASQAMGRTAHEQAAAHAAREKEIQAMGQAARAEADRLIADARARHAKYVEQQAEMERQVISYREMQEENAILKRDLQNIDVNLNKLTLDGELRDRRQREIDARATELATRYLSENVKQVVASVGPNNFTACKQRLADVIGRCRGIGFNITESEESRLMAELRSEFEKAVRAQIEREEQARIKAQIREEERLKREIERELKQLERERAAVQAALDQAMAEARGQYSAEVERLKARLTEAEEKAKRTMSMAEQTKAGHVYVISNIGSMGPGVFKIGMTRRLEPKERIDELGSASVPFPFDIHMMIQCDNAPALENAFHKAFHKHRVNRANPRKEFFRTTIDEIARVAREQHCEVKYTADAEALEYNQSLAMSDDDAAFIERVYEAADAEGAGIDD